jgi:ribosomal-protein-alanine N-acetyltransferase
MLRVGGYGDYHQLARIHSANFERGWSADELRDLLEQQQAKAFVYDLEGSRAGFVLLRCVADECEILTIAVDEQYKRQGIGRKLVEQAQKHAFREGAKTVFLEVAEDNDAARALYEACGFSEHGRRKDYYRRWHGRRVDALTLRYKTT